MITINSRVKMKAQKNLSNLLKSKKYVLGALLLGFLIFLMWFRSGKSNDASVVRADNGIKLHNDKRKDSDNFHEFGHKYNHIHKDVPVVLKDEIKIRKNMENQRKSKDQPHASKEKQKSQLDKPNIPGKSELKRQNDKPNISNNTPKLPDDKPKTKIDTKGSNIDVTNLGYFGAHDKCKGLHVGSQKVNGITQPQFLLDCKPFRILSGSMHYFRTVPEHWRARLRLMKAAGLNTVTTYVAWNMHEKYKGQWSFENGLDIAKFITTAKEEGLYVSVRPGPYICNEWDWGGLPSWLLRDPKMKVRTTYQPFLDAAELYISKLMEKIGHLQYSKGVGGPIISFQIENEYASWNNDTNYMEAVKKMFLKTGATELLYACDGPKFHLHSAVPDNVVRTSNFFNIRDVETSVKNMKIVQPATPLYVTEFWSGWFDWWGNSLHHKSANDDTLKTLRKILEEKNGSVNFFMFHGGTNFGFMNGANLFYINPTTGKHEMKLNGGLDIIKPHTTSYDYDAPINEWGRISAKFLMIKALLDDLFPKLEHVKIEEPPKPTSYGSVEMTTYLPLEDVINQIGEGETKSKPISMEMLDINKGSGQAGGFIYYKTSIKKGETLKILGRVRDFAHFIINGNVVARLNFSIPEPKVDLRNVRWKEENELGILIENMGRANYFIWHDQLVNQQFKGLMSDVSIDGQVIKNEWHISALEFKEGFNLKLRKWNFLKSPPQRVPVLFKTSFKVENRFDTFLNMTGWGKGVAFINGFNLGRYWYIGPQHSLYIPGPLLHVGDNELLIFETMKIPSDMTVNLVDEMIMSMPHGYFKE